MYYLDVSFTHKNTDISMREKLALDENKQREILRLMRSNQAFIECLSLNTCNRVEIFAFVNDLENAKSYAIKALSILSGIASSELEKRADFYFESGAIHHIFSVASSLDSLVVGETQIVGQLKDAQNFAISHGTCGLNLNRALNSAYKCAASVRNQTTISKNPVSVSSVAVSKAKEIFGDLSSRRAVVVGAGDMAELACKHLHTAGAKITIVNRTLKNAKILAESISKDTEFKDFSELKTQLNTAQLIFSATSSSEPVITNDQISPVSFDRYFFDIAVPRDIDIDESERIKVYSVDDLQEIVKLNLSLREEQAQIAYAIIGKATQEFFKWLRELAITPIVKALRFSAKEVAETELNKAIKKGYLKNSDLNEAKKLVHQIFKAFLHKPTVNLKSLESDDEIETQINYIAQIFDLKEKFELFSNNMENSDEIQ